jgi:hypothetical protein
VRVTPGFREGLQFDIAGRGRGVADVGGGYAAAVFGVQAWQLIICNWLVGRTAGSCNRLASLL